MPSIDTSVASVVRQVSVEFSPGLIATGFAVSVAVGAALVAAGGGGGGGGAAFLWQPVTAIKATASASGATREARKRRLASEQKSGVFTVSPITLYLPRGSDLPCEKGHSSVVQLRPAFGKIAALQIPSHRLGGKGLLPAPVGHVVV